MICAIWMRLLFDHLRIIDFQNFVIAILVFLIVLFIEFLLQVLLTLKYPFCFPFRIWELIVLVRERPAV